MNIRFILFVAFRYFKEKRKSKRTASSVLSSTGIAVGVMTLTAVIGVMNGFQLSFIEPLINIGSFHIQISGGPVMDERKTEMIRDIDQVEALIPFSEHQALIEGNAACILRGIPANINEIDPSFQESFDTDFNLIPGETSIGEPDTILLGYLLASHLGVHPGDSVSITTFPGNWSSKKNVTGTFQTWYHEIDRNWAFISLETASGIVEGGKDPSLIYGVKLKNRFGDREAVMRIKKILEGTPYVVRSWREFNKTFFNALLMEKILMMLLIGLIFIVVGFNIFHSLKRSVFERKEEIAVFKALGASPGGVRNIFIFEGFLIGISGCLVGVILGLVVTHNINELFRLTEFLINDIVFANLEKLLSFFLPDLRFQRVSIFSPDVFYIKQVPVRVLLPETLFICFFSMLSSTAAAWFASGKVVSIKPAEILRYE
ncbi:MAG: ABC transporter permease [Spirochaetales bacterium]|nr:ABC transporter permease [Spirochaetales bacterium]